ncbi:MAG: phosphoribosyltransferase domain-containing protein, partial [Anaerotignaceae bacterium]
MQIAKRENNNKRNFLVVNENQGKHVPVKPSIPLNLFEDLAKKVKAELGNRKILVIGFAETATAIGTHMALSLNSPYIQTTREVMEEEFIYFSEAHSHATEQKVVSRFIEETDFHTILFVEDEVTTGNTILNGISAIEKHFNKKFNYGVCSLINGMSDENINKFKDLNIDVIYLEKLVNNGFEEIANSFSSNGIYVKCQNIQSDCKTITIKKEIEPRSGVYPEALKNACNNVWLKVKDFSLKGNVLVIGTEEFMYLPMYIAGKIEEQGNTVYYH